MLIGGISMLAVIILAMLRVPLAFALLGVSIVGMGLAVSWQTAFLLVPITISDAVFSYDLAVVPMFILMGNVIAKTGIARDLFKAAFAFVGHMRGGLALSTMIACSGFSAVCGSSYATAATMTKVAYPSLKRYGYSDKISAGTIAAGGTLGIHDPSIDHHGGLWHPDPDQYRPSVCCRCSTGTLGIRALSACHCRNRHAKPV